MYNLQRVHPVLLYDFLETNFSIADTMALERFFFFMEKNRKKERVRERWKNRIDQISGRGLKIQQDYAAESFLDECLRFQQ